jgi:hypothetical protein
MQEASSPQLLWHHALQVEHSLQPRRASPPSVSLSGTHIDDAPEQRSKSVSEIRCILPSHHHARVLAKSSYVSRFSHRIRAAFTNKYRYTASGWISRRVGLLSV